MFYGSVTPQKYFRRGEQEIWLNRYDPDTSTNMYARAISQPTRKQISPHMVPKTSILFLWGEKYFENAVSLISSIDMVILF